MKKKNLLLAFPILFCFSLSSCNKNSDKKDRKYAYFLLSRYNLYSLEDMIMYPFGRAKVDNNPFNLIFYLGFMPNEYVDLSYYKSDSLWDNGFPSNSTHVEKYTISIIDNDQELISHTFQSDEIYSRNNLMNSYPFSRGPELINCNVWFDLNSIFKGDYDGIFTLRETKEVYFSNPTSRKTLIDDYSFEFYKDSNIEFLKCKTYMFDFTLVDLEEMIEFGWQFD